MKSILAPLVLAFCCAVPVVAVEREVNRTFAVQPGCTLVVESYHGDIVIVESDDAEVRLALHLDYDVDTEAEADQLRAGLSLVCTSVANTISIVARHPAETGPRFSWEENKRMNLYYQISVPRECHLALRTGKGSITVGRIAGRMLARVEEGTIFFRQVDGSIDASTERGDVIISRCSGSVRARVGRGAIRLGTIGGPSDLRNSNGGIEVMKALGALTAFAEVGDVMVNFPRETSQPAKLTSSGGNMHVHIDPEANCEVAATSTWGRVENSLDFKGGTGTSGRRHLAGRMNEGGPLLQFRANGGSVKIEPGATLFE